MIADQFNSSDRNAVQRFGYYAQPVIIKTSYWLQILPRSIMFEHRYGRAESLPIFATRLQTLFEITRPRSMLVECVRANGLRRQQQSAGEKDGPGVGGRGQMGLLLFG